MSEEPKEHLTADSGKQGGKQGDPARALSGGSPTIPAEYASRPLSTRLWLQSRLKPATRKRLAKAAKGKRSPTRSDFIQACKLRKLTLEQCGIALQMASIGARRLWVFLQRPEPENGIVMALAAQYIGILGAQSLLPASKLWSTSQLLNLVEASLGAGGAAPWRAAVTAGLVVVAATTMEQWSDNQAKRTETLLTAHLEYLNETELIRMRLAQPVRPSRDPVDEAMLREASLHCGQWVVVLDGKRRTGSYELLSHKISSLASIFRNVVSIGTQLAITYDALRGPDGNVTTNLLVFLLFTAPLIYDILYPAEESRLNRRTRQDRFQEAQKVEEMFFRNREQALLLRLGDIFLETWKRFKEQGIAEQYKSVASGNSMRPAIVVFHTLVWVLLATGAVHTSGSLATLVVLQNAVMGLAAQVHSVMHSARYLTHSVLFMGAYLAICDELEASKTRTDLVNYEDVRDPSGCMAIEVKDVSISYPGQPHAAVQGINLSIARGETLAIVGFNGSGKTTLVKAILGVLGTTHGSIEINGISVTQYDWSTLAYRISAMFQEFARFGTTLGREVGFGSVEHVDDEDALAAAIEAGGAAPVVARVPLSTEVATLDTDQMREIHKISPDTDDDTDNEPDTDDGAQKEEKEKKDKHPWAQGTALSGGEWQRVALARAFMGADRADLVVFDEPTAALDPRAEAELFDTLLSLSKRGARKCTTIFISHQFGNVRRADKIAFMEKGAIVEYGTHEELMRLDGKYAELFGLQAKGFVSQDEA